MATSFIGKSISLLSHSDVRYRGILAGLDPVNSTIQLQNVFSMGTERRRPAEEYIPPAEQPYQYIIFRASEVKDLALDNEAPIRPRNVHDDPAVIGAMRPPPKEQYEEDDDEYQGGGSGVRANLGARPPPQQAASVSPVVTAAVAVTAAPLPPSVPSANGLPAVPEQPTAKRAAPQQQQQREDVAATNPAVVVPAAAATSATGRASAVNRKANASVNSVHSATQSLENVERALGEIRLQNAQASANGNGGGRGGRRSGGGGRDRNNNNNNNNHGHAPMTIPTTEFDFESANARFKKTTPRKASVVSADGEDSDSRTNPSDEEDTESKASSNKVAKDDKAAGAYNPKASFFDSLSSSSLPSEGGGRGGRGRGRGRGGNRNRKEEERERNFATFGEAGGIGLMGPDAYVGGYGGGYGRGRRGGGRGGRGRGPRRGASVSVGGDQ